MELEGIIRQYNFNYEYAKALVQDLTEDQMTIIPSSGLENHPAFTLGHLISGSQILGKYLDAEIEMPDKWKDLFLRKGPGDSRKPDADKSKYPSKNELLNELKRQHENVISRLSDFDKSRLNEDFQWRFANHLPKLYDVVLFMCINHEAMHLGQLAAWRRAMNLPSALGTL